MSAGWEDTGTSETQSPKEVSDLLVRAANAHHEAQNVCASRGAITAAVRADRDARTQLVRRCYGAHPDTVSRAREAVTRLMTTARVRGNQVSAVRRAVTEAVTNAVVHAYDGRPGLVHLTAVITDDELIVFVADDGRGPHRAFPSSSGGRGWVLIAEATDDYTISHRAAGGTLIEMRWSLSPRDPREPSRQRSSWRDDGAIAESGGPEDGA